MTRLVLPDRFGRLVPRFLLFARYSDVKAGTADQLAEAIGPVRAVYCRSMLFKLDWKTEYGKEPAVRCQLGTVGYADTRSAYLGQWNCL